MRILRPVGLAAAALTTVALAAGPASAHDCIQTQKNPDSGGIIGTYDVLTDTFTPSGQPGNAGLIAVRLPDGSVIVSFSHGPASHDGVVPGAKDCDGKGLDSFEACMGI